MIHAIGEELAAALRIQGVPYLFVHGPEPLTSLSATRERIVLEEPFDAKRDSFGPPKAVHTNPRMPLIAVDAARLRIFARSNLTGPGWHDHARLARRVRDHVLVELDAIVRARKNTMTIRSGGFVTLVDAKGSSVWNGAVYELDIEIDRGLFRTKWTGEAREEVTIGTDVTIAPATLNVSGG